MFLNLLVHLLCQRPEIFVVCMLKLYYYGRKETALTVGGVHLNAIVLGQVCNLNIVDRHARLWSSRKVETSLSSMIFQEEMGKLRRQTY